MAFESYVSIVDTGWVPSPLSDLRMILTPTERRNGTYVVRNVLYALRNLHRSSLQSTSVRRYLRYIGTYGVPPVRSTSYGSTLH